MLTLNTTCSFTGGTTVGQGTLDLNYGNTGTNIGTLSGTLLDLARRIRHCLGSQRPGIRGESEQLDHHLHQQRPA